MLEVLRKSAIFQESVSMSKVPSRSFVRAPFGNVHAPAAIYFLLVTSLCNRQSCGGKGILESCFAVDTLSLVQCFGKHWRYAICIGFHRKSFGLGNPAGVNSRSLSN